MPRGPSIVGAAKKSRPAGAGRQKSLSGSSTFGLSRELDRFSRDVVDRFFKGCGSTLAFQGLSVAVQRIWIKRQEDWICSGLSVWISFLPDTKM
jgi:hypothetical protein